MTFEKKLAKHLKIAVKTSWRHGNNGVKVRVPVGELEREDGTFATTDTHKAELLNQLFTSVFTMEDKENMLTTEERHRGNILRELEITRNENTNKVEVDKYPGPAQDAPACPTQTTERVSFSTHKTLSTLSRQLNSPRAVENSTYVLEEAIKKSPSNHRPVSLTCVWCATSRRV